VSFITLSLQRFSDAVSRAQQTHTVPVVFVIVAVEGRDEIIEWKNNRRCRLLALRGIPTPCGNCVAFDAKRTRN